MIYWLYEQLAAGGHVPTREEKRMRKGDEPGINH